MRGWQSESTDGPKRGWSCAFWNSCSAHLTHTTSGCSVVSCTWSCSCNFTCNCGVVVVPAVALAVAVAVAIIVVVVVVVIIVVVVGGGGVVGVVVGGSRW